MTGRLRLGKTSTFIRHSARPLPTSRPARATRTVIGWRMAKTIGFIGTLPEVPGRERLQRWKATVGRSGRPGGRGGIARPPTSFPHRTFTMYSCRRGPARGFFAVLRLKMLVRAKEEV